MNSMKVIKTPIRGKALCIFPDETLLCYKSGSFQLYDTKTYSVLSRFSLPNGKYRNTLSKVRILERLLHCEARWALPIGDRIALICMKGGIYRVDCQNGEYTTEHVPVQGRPLSVAQLQGIQGFDDSVVIGDYTGNPERKPVSLYQRNTEGEWRCAYTFPAGSNRHIHGVFADQNTQKVYILTGDEDSESGIWLASDNFKTVKPILVGSQQYRACQMVATDDGLLYMTDAPSEKNAIYKYVNGHIKKVTDIEGTCIYGAQTSWGGIFSTTCEPDAHGRNRIDYWLSNKPGKGIYSRHISVFVIKHDGTIETLAGFEHDGLPLRLLQYGTVTFSNSWNGTVYFSAHCVKRDAEVVFRLKSTKE